MLKQFGKGASRVWSRFTVRKHDNASVSIQIIELPEYMFEDFMDFKMEHYVKNEITHKVAGIPKSEDALVEYREYFTNYLKSHAHVINVCCPEENGEITPKIIGFSAQKLTSEEKVTQELEHNSAQVKTKEMKRFFKILHDWNSLCPVPEVMRKYGAKTFFDDGGICTRSDYVGSGIATAMAISRRKVCKAHNVPLTGAWTTTIGSSKLAAKAGWLTVYHISYDDLSKRIGVIFENPPPACRYMIATPWDE